MKGQASPKMLSVANVIEEGRMGGPQRRIVEVAARMNHDQASDASDTIRSIVLMPRADSTDFELLLQEKGVGFTKLPLTRLSRDLKVLCKYFFSFPYEIWRLCTTLTQHHIDVVHCSGGAWQYKGAIAGKLAQCRVVWHVNDTKMPIIIKIIFIIVSIICVDVYILSCRRVKSYYLRFWPLSRKPYHVIYPPVDTNHFRPRRSRNHRPCVTKIVAVSNINPTKGLHFLVEAARILSSYADKTSYHIYGPVYVSQENYARRLMRQVHKSNLKNIFIEKPSANVRGVLDDADIFVCSSIAESGPMSLFEAMAMEKAIVSTDVGDVAQFIHDGSSGYIVPVADPAALADKIETLINQPGLRVDFGQRARATAVKFLDVSIAVRKHEETYRSIISHAA